MSNDLPTFQRGLILLLVSQPGSSLERPNDAFLGFVDKSLFYRLRDSASRPTTDLWMRSPYFCSPEVRWPSYTPWHWVSILVAFYDRHELCCRYSCSWPPHGNSAGHTASIFSQRDILPPFSVRGTFCLHFQATNFYILSLETSKLCR